MSMTPSPTPDQNHQPETIDAAVELIRSAQSDEEALAIEAELIEQSDNRSHEGDG